MDLTGTNYLYQRPDLCDAWWSDEQHNALLADLIQTHQPGARTVLDIGCGTGKTLEDLNHKLKFEHCIGIDLQHGMVDHANSVRPQIDIRVGDMRNVRLNLTADVVLCLGNALSYVHSTSEISQTFGTLAAHSRPDTLLIVQTLVAPTRTPGGEWKDIEFPDGGDLNR